MRGTSGYVQKVASGVGWVSLAIGFALTLEPRGTARFLGLGDRERLSRAIGASDLIVGMGLLLDRNRSRWMLARALLNLAIAIVYALSLADEAPQRQRAVGGLGMMVGLTVVDYSLSRSLKGTDA